MRSIKHIFYTAALLAGCLSMQSCLDDDSDYVPDFMELGTVISTSNDGTAEPVVEGDIYGKSHITNRSVLKDAGVDTEGQRIMYRFVESKSSIASDNDDPKQAISIFYIYKVLTKPMDVLAAGEEDVYGNDPIRILGMYNSAKHLNIQYQIRIGDRDTKHRISLVAPPDAIPDKDGYLTVEFRHNAEGDTASEQVWGYVSYTLESLPGYKEGQLKGLNIRYKSGYGEDAIEKIAIKKGTTNQTSPSGAPSGALDTKTK